MADEPTVLTPPAQENPNAAAQNEQPAGGPPASQNPTPPAGAGTPPPPKAGEGKPADQPGQEKPPAGAPEKYADFQLPTGMQADQAALAGFLPLAKELNLTQEHAQKLVTYQATLMAGYQAAQQKAWEAEQQAWIEAGKADPEIGGAKYEESLTLARQAFGRYATPEFVQLVNETQIGNHPEFVRVFAKIARATAEGQPGGPERNAPPPKRAADILYG